MGGGRPPGEGPAHLRPAFAHAVTAGPGLGARGLPELSAVHWRPRATPRLLRGTGRLWTAWTAAHSVPFVVVAAFLFYLEPLSAPVALASLAHAWIIPELYAFRGAGVLRPARSHGDPGADAVALGLLGDLLDHAERDLHASTGLVLERGELGVWLVGEGGAVLVTPGGRRVHCFCVTAKDRSLPPSDRIAHLLLALRSDEEGFATVANHAFSGAPWRLSRRLRVPLRPALRAARDHAKRR